MCCYTHKTHSADFYTVTNGIVDKFLCPLLIPSTTAHGTGMAPFFSPFQLLIFSIGVICTKHFVRNTELYELYKKSFGVKLEFGSHMEPKNGKGEDAYFIGDDGRSFGLADGIISLYLLCLLEQLFTFVLSCRRNFSV